MGRHSRRVPCVHRHRRRMYRPRNDDKVDEREETDSVTCGRYEKCAHGHVDRDVAHSCFGGLYLANPHGASAAEQGESNSPSRPDLHGIMGMRTPMTEKHPKRPNQLAL